MKPTLLKPTLLKYNDDAHAYWVDGKRWSTASSYGKRIEDGTRLELWGKRMVLKGAAQDPSCLHDVIAHQDDDKALNDIAARCMSIAGANDASRKGSTRHRIFELSDLGKLHVSTPEVDRYVELWEGALSAAGVEILPEYVERVVVCPELGVCGMFDRVARYNGRLVVVDLKTGKGKVAFAHAMAVQLAIYAHAAWLAAGEGVRTGDVTTWAEFEPMPQVDQEVGLIIAMPVDSDEAEVHEIDLERGWRAALLAQQARQWTATKNITRLVATTKAPEVPMATDLDWWAASGGTEPKPVPVQEVAQKIVVDMVRAECRSVADLGPAAGDALMAAWGDLPGLDDPAITDTHLEQILAVVRSVRDRFTRSDAGPGDQWVKAVLAVVPDPEPTQADLFVAEPPPADGPDEGQRVSDEAINAMRAAYGAIPKPLQAIANRWASEANAHGTPIQLSTRRTERRCAVVRAVIACSQWISDDDLMRAALGLVVGDTQPSISVGAYMASLSTGEANRLTELAESLRDKRMGFGEGPTGAITLQPLPAA